MPVHRVFVYGTLKQGFRNFHVNHGKRIGSGFVTVQAFPLYILGPFGLPWLVHEPGHGQPVIGQVFEVDDAGLAEMDWLERVNDADWYTRQPLAVRPVEGGAELAAVAYFGSAARLASETVHHGPLAEYTDAHPSLYHKHL
jgi:gamma-glutamylaminecyclotransferase